MSELWVFEILASEVEVEVEAEAAAEIKTEARYRWQRLRSTTMQNFSLLAWKMSELCPFEILTSEAEVEVKVKDEVKTEASLGRGGLGLLPCQISAS